jgi:hypothetical protein
MLLYSHLEADRGASCLTLPPKSSARIDRQDVRISADLSFHSDGEALRRHSTACCRTQTAEGGLSEELSEDRQHKADVGDVLLRKLEEASGQWSGEQLASMPVAGSAGYSGNSSVIAMAQLSYL